MTQKANVGKVFQIVVDEIYSLPSVSLFGKHIYVVGGITQKSILKSVRIYNLHTKRWTDRKCIKFLGGFVRAAAFLMKWKTSLCLAP